MAEVIDLSSDEESGASNSKPEKLSTVLDDWNQPSTSAASQYVEPPNPVSEDGAFQQVIDACKKQIGNKDEKGLHILTQLQKMYDKIDADSRNAETFNEFLLNVKSQIESNPKRIYIFIKELNDEMKMIMHMPPRSNNCDNTGTKSIANKVNNREDKHAKNNHRIRHLEKLLKLLSQKIKKLEGKELGYDDMDNDDSNYLLEHKYKRHFIKVWKKLCQLNNSAEITGRWIEKRFSYKGSRHEEVNKKVTKYINKYKELPEFHDILDLVTKVNMDYKLLLNPHTEAQRVFTEVVGILRQRRMLDLEEDLLLPTENPDPAEEDLELASSLERSRKLGMQRIDQVIDDFAEKQCKTETNQSSNEQSDTAHVNGDEKEKEELDQSAEVKAKEVESTAVESEGKETKTTEHSGDEEEEDEDEEDDDEEENETDNFDVGQITEEFQAELETEETTDLKNVIDTDTSEDEDSSTEENNGRDNNDSSSDGLPNYLEPISTETNSKKRSLELPPEETTNPKRFHISQSTCDDDDVIILD